SEVCKDWTTAAELVHLAETTFPFVRSPEQNAVITALVVHYRCLVNFVSGDFKGKHGPQDICPEDFLGATWSPSDQNLDRDMRGRLAVLNSEQQHISWKRLEGNLTLWPFGFLIREVNSALWEFTDLLLQQGGYGAAEFDRARRTTAPLLPYREFRAISAVDHAPPR
ncbi:MAG TPA: hypothetical protein VFG33_36360, partial [Kribbella sp.]|uniref:hypothetical protein n=1 Tax=Kribbella sp. TaxID=1871183 RepID=UPI002D77B335